MSRYSLVLLALIGAVPFSFDDDMQGGRCIGIPGVHLGSDQ